MGTLLHVEDRSVLKVFAHLVVTHSCILISCTHLDFDVPNVPCKC